MGVFGSKPKAATTKSTARRKGKHGAPPPPPLTEEDLSIIRHILAAQAMAVKHFSDYGPPPISTMSCVQHAPPNPNPWPENNLLHWQAKGFSQFGADGILHKLFSDLGTTNKYYVEFGTQEGWECNSRRLREACGFEGLLLDGGYENALINQHKHFLTRENIVDLFKIYKVPKEPDLLSVDIDGNDFHVLAAILGRGKYRPRVVMVETNFHPNATADVVIPYQSDRWLGCCNCWQSASVKAYSILARRYNYSIVGSLAPDLYWVRNDVLKNAKKRTPGFKPYQYTNDVWHLKEQIRTYDKLKDLQCGEPLYKRNGYVTAEKAAKDAEHTGAAKATAKNTKSSLPSNMVGIDAWFRDAAPDGSHPTFITSALPGVAPPPSYPPWPPPESQNYGKVKAKTNLKKLLDPAGDGIFRRLEELEPAKDGIERRFRF